MATNTTNFGLIKPSPNDTYNIEDFNGNADIVDKELKTLSTGVAEAKKSASDGKNAIAAAVTQQGVSTAATDTFARMAANILAIITGSGNAVSSQVLTPYTFTNSTGIEQVGAMPNNGAVVLTLNAGGTYSIALGYHNGSGVITAASLSAQTAATAIAAYVLAGYTAWVNGVKITGTIASKAAATITPGTSQQTIAAGQYLAGVQTIDNLGGTATSAYVHPSYTFSSNNAGRAVAGTMALKAAATITPSSSAQIIAANQYLSGVQTIAAIPSYYYNANTQQTVFSYGSYGVPASLGAYYANVNWIVFPTNPAVINSNGSIYLTGTSWLGTTGRETDRIIFRQYMPTLFKYAQITWNKSSSFTPDAVQAYVINPSTMNTVGWVSSSADAFGIHAVNFNLSSYVSQLAGGWVLGISTTYNTGSNGIFEVKLSPAAF